MIKSTFNKIVILGLLIIVLSAGTWFILNSKLINASKAENTSLILEKIKTVTKLISVEGQFSELYDYKESYQYDFFNLFNKKILLRVTAKVSVGFDFEKINISIDSVNRSVTLNELPQPEIISIDHDLDYYDISQGTFNKFTAGEYNMINKKAKEFILEQAKKSDLFNAADKQKKQYIDLMQMALQSGGWKLIVKSNKSILQ